MSSGRCARKRRTYLACSRSGSLGPCLPWVTISPFILLLPSLMFWFLLKVLCQCPPSRVPLPCMLIELCIFYYCCQGKIRDTFSKGTLRGQWTQQGVLPPQRYQSSSHMNGAGSRALSFPQLKTVFRNNQSPGKRPIPIAHTQLRAGTAKKTNIKKNQKKKARNTCTAARLEPKTDRKECESGAITLTLSHGDKHVSFRVSLDGAK